MIAALALAILATTTPTTGYTSWTKNGEAHIRFYDLKNIRGPFKFYVASTGCPQAGCPSCPNASTIAPEHVVAPDKVYQKWQPAGHYVEAIFPLSLVGNCQYFYFTAVTCTAEADVYLTEGAVPQDGVN